MATTPDDDQRTCRHFHSVVDGVTEGRHLLTTGEWEYTTPMRCETCGKHYIEIHIQPTRRPPEERP